MNTIQCTDDVLWNHAPETCITVLTSVTSVNSIKRKKIQEKAVRATGTYMTMQDLVFINCYFKYALVQNMQLGKVKLIYSIICSMFTITFFSCRIWLWILNYLSLLYGLYKILLVYPDVFLLLFRNSFCCGRSKGQGLNHKQFLDRGKYGIQQILFSPRILIDCFIFENKVFPF